MQIDWWTLALQAINVLILIWLLSRFLFRPVMGVIAQRQAAAVALLADAQTAKDAATAEAMALKTRNTDFDAEAVTQRGEMQATIVAEHRRLIEQTKGEAAALIQQAIAANVVERTRMKAELDEKAAILAGQIAQKLLSRVPVIATIDALFEDFLDRVRALPAQDRLTLASDMPLTVFTPVSLEEGMQNRYVRDLQAVLPGLSPPQFAVDISLIAGFEMRGPHVQVHNSWRADLDAVLTALRGNDHDGIS